MSKPSNAPASSTALPLLTEEQYRTLLAAFATIHGIVGSRGETLTFANGGVNQAPVRERLAKRAQSAVDAYESAQRERALAGVRRAIGAVVDAHMVKAQEEKKEFDALSASMKARLGISAWPDHIKVPVSELLGVFGKSLPEEVVVSNLNNIGYKVAKGKEKNAKAYLVVPFKAALAPVAAPVAEQATPEAEVVEEITEADVVNG